MTEKPSHKKKIAIIILCTVAVLLIAAGVNMVIKAEKLENITLTAMDDIDYYYFTNSLSKSEDVKLGMSISVSRVSDSAVIFSILSHQIENQNSNPYNIEDLNIALKFDGDCVVSNSDEYYSPGGGIYYAIEPIGADLKRYAQSDNGYLYIRILLTDIESDVDVTCEVSYDLHGKNWYSLNEFESGVQTFTHTIKAPKSSEQ